MPSKPSSIRCAGTPLKISGTIPLKTTDATINFDLGTFRFSYEPEATQQNAFFISVIAAICIAVFSNVALGGVGLVLLYFLFYAVAAAFSVRNVEFTLSEQELIIDNAHETFGFSVKKQGKRYFLGFKAKKQLIDALASNCRSFQEQETFRQSYIVYPIGALVLGVVIMIIAKAFFWPHGN